eukprot:1137053-Pelagomonas_calceolata.AAC.5
MQLACLLCSAIAMLILIIGQHLPCSLCQYRACLSSPALSGQRRLLLLCSALVASCLKRFVTAGHRKEGLMVSRSRTQQGLIHGDAQQQGEHFHKAGLAQLLLCSPSNTPFIVARLCKEAIVLSR